MFFSASSTSDKIHAKKMAVGYSEPPKPLSAIEDFCERFDKAVKNTFPKVGIPPPPPTSFKAIIHFQDAQ